MKKVITIIMVILALFTIALSQPVLEEPEIIQTIVKIDDQTVEITTTTTTETIVQYDRAELQTELDHIPDRKAAIQEQLDLVNEREAELIEILKVFE